MPARTITAGDIEELVVEDETYGDKLQFVRRENSSTIMFRYMDSDGLMKANFIVEPDEVFQLYEFLGRYLDKRHRKL